MKPVVLSSLPYDYDALKPVISGSIMRLHHSQHHANYVKGTNLALAKLEAHKQSQVDLNVREIMRDLSFNYNGHLLHSIFWQNMRPPQAKNGPTDKLLAKIENAFGSLAQFRKLFSQTALSVEGSGWAVLGQNAEGELVVGQLEKHNLMTMVSFTPVLVIDVWEHAYYLDYHNNRQAYIKAWWSVVNWQDVSLRIFGV